MDSLLNKIFLRKAGIITAAATIIIGSLLTLTYNVVWTDSRPHSFEELETVRFFNFDLPDSNVCGGIRLNLRSAIAIDNETHRVLYCYNAENKVPIASISKLLTAMVILDNYWPDSVMTITSEDARQSSRSIFRVGDKVTVRDLLHTALIRSDNRAARALARSVSGTVEAFALKMNERALRIGLENTEMFEPTGLDERNRSTAVDCARLINYAILYPELARITSLKNYSFKLINRKRLKRIVNTNKLVFSKYKIVAGKTGYISESNYCLTTIIEDGKGKQVTVVVLGAPGPQTRFREARRLAAYAFKKLGSSS
jgi:D-alanyl-D-alanine endopeptidase (penicillin-binding protein 7)